MGGIGAILAAAADPRVGVLVASSAPADPYRLTRQTFRLARLPIPDPIAYPLAWLTTRVYVRPRGHVVARYQRHGGDRPLPRARPARPRRRRRRRPAGHLERLAAAARAAAADGPTAPRSRPLLVAGGQHSWLYEVADYRRAVARVAARGARWTAGPRRGRPRSRPPPPPSGSPTARPRFAAIEEIAGGARTLAQVALPGRDPRVARDDGADAGDGRRDSPRPEPRTRDDRGTRLGRDRPRRAIRRFADRPLDAGHLERILRRRASRRQLARTCSAGRSSSAATASTCASSSAVGPWAGHLAGAAVGIALVTPDPRGGGCAAVGHVRPRAGGREHDAGGLGARASAACRRPSTTRTSPAGCSATRPTSTASTCCRSATRPTRPTSPGRRSAGGRVDRSTTIVHEERW